MSESFDVPSGCISDDCVDVRRHHLLQPFHYDIIRCELLLQNHPCSMMTLRNAIEFFQFELVALSKPLQNIEQECIPVGCVQPVAVGVCWGRGVSASLHAWIHPPGCGPGDTPSPLDRILDTRF